MSALRSLCQHALLLAAGMATPLAMAAGDMAAPLKAFEARYEVSRNGARIGQAELRLSADSAGRWRFETHTKGTEGMASLVGADIRESTEFRWADGKPQLLRSRYEQQVAWKSRKREIDVDEVRSVVHSRDDKGSAELALPPDLIDQHGTVLALAAALARGDAELRFNVAIRRKIEENVYRDAGPESVSTPAGEYAAQRIERVRSKNPGRTTTSWLAPSLGYMPVRILQTEPEGDVMELKLTRIEQPAGGG